MANTKKKDRYDDDDEINKSIKEFQQGDNVVIRGDDELDEDEDARQEALNTEQAAEPQEEKVVKGNKKPVPSVDRKRPEFTILDSVRCNCCDAPWKLVGDKFKQPGCGCAIHPTCKECQKCGAHCHCREGVLAQHG